MARPVRALWIAASLPLALLAQGTSPGPVLLVVPPATPLAVIERARAVMPAGTPALLVAEADRVAVEGGLEILVDRTFATAPPASVVVLLAPEAGRRVEDFLSSRRGTARAILVPAGSAVGRKLKEDGAAGALIFAGGVDAIPALLAAIGFAAPTVAPRAPEPVATAPRPTAAPVPRTPTPSRPTGTRPAGKSGVFDRYFSSSAATPTASPTPGS